MVVRITCAHCGADFSADTRTYDALRIDHLPRRCPTCYDREQGRAEHHVVTERRCLGEWDAVRVAIHRGAFRAHNPDPTRQPNLRAIYHAPGHGAAHSGGRLDIYAIGMGTDPSQIPEVCRLRWMEATHAAPPPALEQKHGPAREWSPTWQYLVLERQDVATPATAALVVVSAESKTTLKGFGRQYHATLRAEGAFQVLRRWERWAKETGWFSTASVMALVDDDHPIYVSGVGSGEAPWVRRYDLAAPQGREVEDLLEVAP